MEASGSLGSLGRIFTGACSTRAVARSLRRPLLTTDEGMDTSETALSSGEPTRNKELLAGL
jgi:hypothetical protein